jgi:hypothetical protein
LDFAENKVGAETGDVAALHALILAERAERRAEQAARSAELVAKQIEIEHLRAMLAKLRRQRYGRSSEKLDDEIEQLELTLEDAEMGQAQAAAKAADAGQGTGQGEQQTSRLPSNPRRRHTHQGAVPRERPDGHGPALDLCRRRATLGG